MKYINLEGVPLRKLRHQVGRLSRILLLAFAVTGARAQAPVGYIPGEQIGAVSPNTDKLDIFPADYAGQIFQFKWEPGSPVGRAGSE